MVEQLSLFLSAAIVLTVSPGPDIIYVFTQSVSNGRKAGLLTTAGLVTGIVFHTSLLAFGLSPFITHRPLLLYGIKIFGAAYLFYLAWVTYKSDSSLNLDVVSAPEGSHSKLFFRGLLMNLINPKVIIFFLAFFPGFLWNTETGIGRQFFILGGLFMLQTAIVFGLTAIFASRLSQSLRKNKKFDTVLKGVQIAVFIGIGIYIIL